MYNLCGSLNRPSSQCYQKNLYHKSQSKSVNFTFSFEQTSFFVIFLCYRVKRFLAIPVAMVTIIRNFKNYYFVFALQMYIMSNMFKKFSYSVVLEEDSLL